MTHSIPGKLLDRLQGATRFCVLTGAGVSAESGVPTFRDAQEGLWEQYDPMQLATPQAFAADPELVWRWYQWRRELVQDAEPNPGHFALVELEQLAAAFTLITQNVDSLHSRAGSQNVIEYHGNLFTTRCSNGCEGSVADKDAVPTCQQCGGLARPGVVWFGESIPEHAIEASVEAVQNCDVMLCVGTSSQVYPAAALSALAHEHGAVTVEINPQPTRGAEFDFVLPGKSGLILPELVASIFNQASPAQDSSLG